MPNDWLPRKDAEFKVWLDNFYAQLLAYFGTLGLPAGIDAPVAAAKTDWDIKYPAHLAAQVAAQVATAAKDTSRETVDPAVRALVMLLQEWPTMTDAIRTALGIPVRDEAPSLPSGGAVTTLATAQIVTSTLLHRVWFFEVGKKKGSARPAGMKGCEIRSVVLPADQPTPTDFGLYAFLAIHSHAPYDAQYTSADGGKTAHYIFRWITTHDEPGPWSDPVSATIPKV